MDVSGKLTIDVSGKLTIDISSNNKQLISEGTQQRPITTKHERAHNSNNQMIVNKQIKPVQAKAALAHNVQTPFSKSI